MTRVFSLAHVSVLELDPPALVRTAAQAGYDHVGMRLYPARPEEKILPMSPGMPLLRETLSAMRESGVAVLDVELVWLRAGMDVEAYRPLMETAAGLGARHLVVTSRDAASDALADVFAQVCALAAPYGLQVSLEFLTWTPLATLTDALRVVRTAGAANGRVMLDALHLSRSGASLSAGAEVPHELIGYVQLCDAPKHVPATPQALAEEAKFGRLLPGDGALDLSRYLRNMPARTAISLEVPNQDRHGMTAVEWASQALCKTRGLLEAMQHG